MKVLCVGTAGLCSSMILMISAKKPEWETIASDDFDWALRTAKSEPDINTVILDGSTMTDEGTIIIKEVKTLLPKAQFIGIDSDVALLGKLDAVGCDKLECVVSDSLFRIIIED